jgi:Uma2 family endonuclease
MANAALKRDARYTYADYLQWSEEERWELINGVAYNMTPAPSINHQRISRELLVQFATFLKAKKCEIFDAPFDVRLPAPGESDETTGTVVQPDLVVVCDPSKLDERGCKGAPDLVIEILSPDSVVRDMKEKFVLYERAGVQEYWVVYPAEKMVMVFHRGSNGAYGRPANYTSEDRVLVGVLPELEIDLATVFAE